MIPKIIHFCWLSQDSYPDLIAKCIRSWKEILPDYEIKLWSLENSPQVSWVLDAYKHKKYAFAADYIRFFVLYRFGGIYLDSDVEVIKSFDSLLSNKSFIGFETNGDFEAAIIGAEKGCAWIKDCLDLYDRREFILPNGKFDLSPVPLLINKILFNKFQIHNSKHIDKMFSNSEITVYPYYFFSPKNIYTKRLYIKKETLCIHHFEAKWVERSVYFRIRFYTHYLLIFIFGVKWHNYIVRLLRWK